MPEFTLNALANGNGRNRMYWMKDGEEALDFLHHRRRWADASAAPRPGLILLDINKEVTATYRAGGARRPGTRGRSAR